MLTPLAPKKGRGVEIALDSIKFNETSILVRTRNVRKNEVLSGVDRSIVDRKRRLVHGFCKRRVRVTGTSDVFATCPKFDGDGGFCD